MAIITPGARISLRIAGPVYSWSENYHTPLTTFVAVQQATFQLATARAIPLTGDCLIKEARLTFEGLPIKARLTGVTPGGGGVQGSYGGVLSEEEIRVLIEIYDVNNNRNHIFLGGVPNNAITDDNQILAAWGNKAANFANYIGSAAASGLGVRYLSSQTNLRNMPVTNISATYPRGAILTIPTYNIGSVGSILRLKSPATAYAGLTGLKSIISIATDTVGIGGAVPIGVLGPVVLPNQVTATQEDVNYAPNVSAAPIRPTRRAPGRPFDLSRGRLPNRIPLRR